MTETSNNRNISGSNGSKTTNGGVWKSIVIGLITVFVSVVLSIYSSGETAGQQKEKITQLEAKYEKTESLRSSDHDILLKIQADVAFIKEFIKEQKIKGVVK